ncbi:hypothetical protein LLH23_05295 [bacterium]|nr:hypothetical protein [bacterium]
MSLTSDDHMRFAVYFIPEAPGMLYRLGTGLLGYDVRAPGVCPDDLGLRGRLAASLGPPHSPGGFDPGWVERASRFGFHLTICDAIDLKVEPPGEVEEKLSQVQERIREVLGYLKPGREFWLLPPDDGRSVDFFPSGKKRAVVLKYKPSDALRVLETLLVALVNPLGTGSSEHSRLLQTPLPDQRTYTQLRTLKFYSSTVFDSYCPHLTLLDPCPDLLACEDTRDRIRQFFTDEFRDYLARVPVTNVCLLVKRGSEAHWRIREEFPIGPARP